MPVDLAARKQLVQTPVVRLRARTFAIVVGLGTVIPATAWADEAPATPNQVPANEGAVDLTTPTPEPEPEPEPFHPMFSPSVRRCGFTVGLNLGVGIGSVSGFPNDAKLVGNDDFRTTEFALGVIPEVYVGGALLDWFVMGASLGMGPVLGADHTGGFFNMGVHIDVFPAFALGDEFQDLGIMLNAGIGQVQVAENSDPDFNVIDSSLGGHLGIGMFYEGIEFWKISMGPYAAFDTVFSASAARPMAWVGWRTAFYGGPPR